MDRFDIAPIRPVQARLNAHQVYARLRSLAELRVFMAHHVYSVWDFMSLIKYLQAQVAPAQVPWVPRGNPAVRYFINQLVLEEESDHGQLGPGGSTAYASHFEFYCQAMGELGADPSGIRRFVETVASAGVAAALALPGVPEPSRRFVGRTFAFIDTGKPHVVAAALALGREHIIPGMFRVFLERMGIDETQAPAFHYYLNRHIHLDEDFHGPLSIQLLEELCGGDPARLREAREAAVQALEARIDFWDGVLAALDRRVAA